MDKYINSVIYILTSILVIMLYLNVPVYCSASGECSWFKYILPSLAFFSIVVIFTKIRGVSFLNLFIVLLYFTLLLLSIASYSFIGDDFSLLGIDEYFNALIIIIILSIFFRFSYLNGNNSALIILIATIFAIFFNLVDIFAPNMYFNSIEGFGVRAAGFYVNANNAALGILAGMTLSITSLPNSLRIWYALVSLLGVVVTFSRGGLIIWLCLYVFLLLKNKIPRFSGLLVLFSLVFVSALIPSLLKYLSKYNSDLYLIADRLDFFTGSATKQDVTSDARYYLVEYSLQAFDSSPIFGNGTNSLLRLGSDQLSHNQYLSFLTDYGVLGFLGYIIFIIYLYIKKSDYREFVILLLVASFFTHNIFNSYIFMIAFAYISNCYRKNSVLSH